MEIHLTASLNDLKLALQKKEAEVTDLGAEVAALKRSLERAEAEVSPLVACTLTPVSVFPLCTEAAAAAKARDPVRDPPLCMGPPGV